MNVVMTGDGRFVEVQGTAEGAPFDRAELDALLDAGRARAAPSSPGCSSRRWRPEAVRVFLASRNAKKLAEMRRILEQYLPDVEVLGLDDVTPYDEPVEDQPTFEGNALLKARAGLAATGLPSRRRRQRALRRRAQRHAGRAVGPLVRPAARTTATTATTRCCSTSSPTCPTSAAAPTSPAPSPSALPGTSRWWSRAGCPGG